MNEYEWSSDDTVDIIDLNIFRNVNNNEQLQNIRQPHARSNNGQGLSRMTITNSIFLNNHAERRNQHYNCCINHKVLINLLIYSNHQV